MTTTVAVTIHGETRDVEFESGGRMVQSVSQRALFSKGGKNWSRVLTAFVQKDGSLKVIKTETIMNRCGYRAVAWDDNEDINMSEHGSR